jgi:hypothetical protein
MLCVCASQSDFGAGVVYIVTSVTITTTIKTTIPYFDFRFLFTRKKLPTSRCYYVSSLRQRVTTPNVSYPPVYYVGSVVV